MTDQSVEDTVAPSAEKVYTSSFPFEHLYAYQTRRIR